MEVASSSGELEGYPMSGGARPGDSSGAENGRGLFALAALAALLLLIMPYAAMLISGTEGLVGLAPEDAEVAGDGDPYHHAWQFWWVSRAISSGQDPRFCTAVYQPEGASLAYDHVGWFDTLIFAAAGMGERYPGLSHTLAIMTGTVLTAVFGWLLARSWDADRYGALFTAMALAWLPARTAHLLQHYQVADCWALPAALWAATLYYRDGGRGKLGLFFGLTLAGALESPFIAVFIGAGIPVVKMMRHGNRRRMWTLLLVWALPAALLGLATVTSPGVTGRLAPDWREAVYWAAEPQSLALPSPFGTAGSLAGMPVRMSWMSNVFEGVVTPGMIIMILLLIYTIRSKDYRFLLAACGFWLLAMGPELRLLGRPLGVPLPFRIIQLLPVLDGIRAPSRFAIAGGLFAALAAGMAVSGLRGRWKYVAFSLLVIEMGVPSLPVLSMRVPGPCLEIGEGSTVLELPVDRNVRRYSWFQAAGGYGRRYSFMARQPDAEDPGLLMDRSLRSGDVLMYHRWLYGTEERCILDGELESLFPGSSPDDSVWVRFPEG